jgi:hypothetical protein
MAPHEKNMPVQTLQVLSNWFDVHTKIYFKNGKDSGRRITSFSSNQLYASFKVSHPNQSVGKKIFVQVQKNLHILKNKHQLYDLFSCHKCHSFNELEKQHENEKDPEKKKALKLKLLKIELHKETAAAQWKAFHEQCANLSDDECLILQDFGKLFTQEGKAAIHVMVLFYKIEEKLVWRYIDFFDHNSKGKSDFEFLESSWFTLFRLNVLSSFKFIYIWMDGGAGDFYNTTALYFYSLFQSLFNIGCSANFYEAYHGHSRCDGHIGNGKKKVKRLLQLLNQSFDNQFVFTIFSSLKDTDGFEVEVPHGSMNRAKTLKGIIIIMR